MKYELKISADLGINYCTVSTMSKELEDIKKIALALDNKGEVRWVIVDDKDEPQFWCQYIEGNLQTPKDAAIATDDIYVMKLVRKQGRTVFTTLDIMKKAGIPDAEEKLAGFDFAKVDMKAALATLRKLVSDGVIERIPSELDESKIGKELFVTKKREGNECRV